MLFIKLIKLSLVLLSAQTFGWHEANNGKIRWNDNCDFNGADIESKRSRGEDCGSLCYRMESCTRFVWTHHDGGTCWLKNGHGDAFYSPNHGSCGSVNIWKDVDPVTTVRPTFRRSKLSKIHGGEDLNPRNYCKNAEDCGREATRYNR